MYDELHRTEKNMQNVLQMGNKELGNSSQKRREELEVDYLMS